MESNHVCHGHTRSMSSIATTVVPLICEPALSPSPPEPREKRQASPLLESRIPLPPSPSDTGETFSLPNGISTENGPSKEDLATHVRQELDEAQQPVIPVFDPAEPGNALTSTKAEGHGYQDQRMAVDDLTSLEPSHEVEDGPVTLKHPEILNLEKGTGHETSQRFSELDGQDTPTQATAPSFPMDIGSLLDAFRRNRDEAERCLVLKRKVYGKLRQAGHKKRTVTALQHRSRQLIECLHKDRATTFSSLYTEAEDKAAQADSVDVANTTDRDSDSPFLNSASSWAAHLSHESETTMISLLNNIRNDDNFLADRIAQLPPSQLSYLSRLHRSAAGSEPDLIHASRGGVLPQASRPPSRFSIRPDSFESVSDLRRDPLQLLVHSLWNCQGDATSDEYYRRQAVWSSVCVKLITKGVTGSDNFCVAVLNEFAMDSPWKLRPQFEMLLLEWMKTGAFILDSQAAPWYDGELEEARRTRLAADEPRFCDFAVRQLLELLANNSHIFMPKPCLDLIHSTLERIPDAERRQKAQGYFVLVWYCQAFLSDAMLRPETQDLLPKHHISLLVRQKLLRSIFHRLQTTIAAALSSSQASCLPLPTFHLVRRIIESFEPPSRLPEVNRTKTPLSVTGPLFLLLRRSDVLAVCMSLFPIVGTSTDLQSSSMFERTFGMPSASTATSIGTVTPLAGTASSLAPSTSSTSITSDTFFTNPVLTAAIPDCGASEASAQSHTPRSSQRFLDDTHYVALARDLQGIAASPQMVQTKKGPDAAGALFFLDGNRVSLAAPRPGNCSNSQDDLRNCSLSDSQTSSLPLSLYDMLESCLAGLALEAQGRSVGPQHQNVDAVVDSLKSLVQAKAAECQACFDFQTAHQWHRVLVTLDDGCASQIHSVLRQLSASVQARSQVYESLNSMYQDWLYHLGRRLQTLEVRMAALAATRRSLRDKMWFASDVRHSKIYEEAAQVARALITMGGRDSGGPKERGISAWAKKKWKSLGPERAETKMLAELSAGRDRGGKAKLADKQAEMTERWLISGSIENFCHGEERIHRFCLEIRRAVDRLVAETPVASPSLWSSILFARERAEFGGLRSRTLAMSTANLKPGPVNEQGRTSEFTGTPSAGASRIFPFSLSPPQSRQSNGDRYGSSEGKTIASTLRVGSPRSSDVHTTVKFNTYTPGRSQNPSENSLGLFASWPLPPTSPLPKSLLEKEQVPPAQRQFLNDLRESVTSLLVSDLGLLMWVNGSETDDWLRAERYALGNVSVEVASQQSPDMTRLIWIDDNDKSQAQTQGNQQVGAEAPEEAPNSSSRREQPSGVSAHFLYEDAFMALTSKLRLSMDPYAKLDAIYELVRLATLAPLLEDTSKSSNGKWPYAAGPPDLTIPRTGLTRLQEVTANCEERRRLSIATDRTEDLAHPRHRMSGVLDASGRLEASTKEWLGDPHIMNLIQALLLDHRFYPDTLYRDLQFIAAFVPKSVLDETPRGTAFWTMGVVAMQLKSALTAGMVDRAGQILAHHYVSDTREPIRNESRGNSPRISGEEVEETSYGIQGGLVYKGKMTNAELRATSLADAARLYTLAALEGDPTAARELGLFYLTKPEIVKRVTLPLSKPCEVFRNVPYPGAANGGEARHTASNAGRGDFMDVDTENIQHGSDVGGGLEPAIFAIALHWMEFAAGAGDPDARAFLDENGDLKKE